jgi:transposase
LLGDGRALTAPCSRRRWRKKVPVPTQRIGGKKGSKRHLLVDGRGVPLSLVVTGANVHDSKGLELVLDAIVVKRPNPPRRRSKHLCADAAYTGTKHAQTMQRHGYIPHVVSRKQEATSKRRNPHHTARRWVVEVCHSWFNRFRKLLVRYEKLDRSFTALNHLAAAIIAFRKVPLSVNIIYG